MNDGPTANLATPDQGRRRRVCAKCGHENPPKTDLCEICSSHLYVVCKRCRHRTDRDLKRCEHCGRRIRRSQLKQIDNLMGVPSARSKTPAIMVEVALGFGLAAVLYKLAVLFF